MSRLSWFLTELTHRLWLRASLYGIVAVLTALVSIYAGRFLPEGISLKLGADAVDGILHILASSMLAVTIFSVNTMVSAYGAATNNVTPRATKLLTEDRVSHRALATFIGTFIFSIVGIIALNAGVYGASGRLVLYAVTIMVVAIVVVTLLRWIEYLAGLGRVSGLVGRVAEAAGEALTGRLRAPYLGGAPLLTPLEIPAGGVPVFHDEIAYIQHIDMGALSDIMDRRQGALYLRAVPGRLVDPYAPLAIVHGAVEARDLRAIRDAFIMGRERSFRQDPRYGFAVLGEIAARALSPAINDPGTAILVIGAGLRCLSLWAQRDRFAAEAKTLAYPRVYVPALSIEELFDDVFSPIAQCGAASLPVMIRLQKAFASLARTPDPDLQRIAAVKARESLARSEAAMRFDPDQDILRQVFADHQKREAQT